MLIFYILLAVEVYVVTVLAPYIAPTRSLCSLKLYPYSRKTMSPFAHAPFSVINQIVVYASSILRKAELQYEF